MCRRGKLIINFGSFKVEASSRTSPSTSGRWDPLRQSTLCENKKNIVATHPALLGVSGSELVVDSRLPHPVDGPHHVEKSCAGKQKE